MSYKPVLQLCFAPNVGEIDKGYLLALADELMVAAEATTTRYVLEGFPAHKFSAAELFTMAASAYYCAAVQAVPANTADWKTTMRRKAEYATKRANELGGDDD